MTVMPVWAQWMQISATLLLGGIVAYVAVQQWQTARSKLRLDLFDRRYAIYKRISGQFGRLLQHEGNLVSFGVAVELRNIRDEAQFLFGPEVKEFLGETAARASVYHEDWHALPNLVSEDESLDLEASTSAEIIHFQTYGKLARLFAPYLSMTDKR